MAKKAVYEFAIKKDVLNSGQVIFTPVCRKKNWIGVFGLYLIQDPWERITKTYDVYELRDLNFTPDLTYIECEEHIIGYQQVLAEKVKDKIATVEFHTLEEKQI